MATLLLAANPFLASTARSQQSDTIVRLATAAKHPAGGSLVEEISIGVMDGAAQYSFVFVVGITVANDGSVFVLDAPIRGTPTLRLYDPKGRYVRDVGKYGGGPGEYRRPSSIAMSPEGKLHLLESATGRITVYSAAGDPLGTWKIPTYRVTLNAGGRFWVDRSGSVAIRIDVNPRVNGPNATAIVRLKPGGAVIDTLLAPQLPDVALPRVSTVATLPSGVRSHVSTGVPYSPATLWEWSPLGYFVTTLTNRYAIDLRRPAPAVRGNRTVDWRAGDPVVSIRRNVPVIEVSGAERRDQRAFVNSRLNSLNGESAGQLAPIPSTKPFFKALHMGLDGRMWINVSAPSERFDPPPRRAPSGSIVPQPGWREPVLMDLFEADGTYIGQVSFPYDFRPLAFRGDQVWGYTSGEFDVQYVKRYRIAWK